MIPILPKLSDVRRAIEIAKQDNLTIIGRTVANGIKVYAIPSRSHPGQVHMPYVDPVAQRVVCDCAGYQYRGVCAHAMVATREVISETQALVEQHSKQMMGQERVG